MPLSAGPGYDPIRDGTYKNDVRVQLLLALFLGSAAFTIFCALRTRYPSIYIANLQKLNNRYVHSASRLGLPQLPRTLFGWIPVVFKISEDQVLNHAGLDAVVFLGFFKMCIYSLAACLVFAVTVITPVRYRFTGRLDVPESEETHFQPFLWMYVAFTYFFTGLIVVSLHRQTAKIIRMRQLYLGKQNSVTDRTIKLLGIPPVLREEEALKRHIESLGVGDVDLVTIVKEWQELNHLFQVRKTVLHRLETAWMEYFKRNGIETADFGFFTFSSVGDSISMESSTIGKIAKHLDPEPEEPSGWENMEGSTAQLPLLSDINTIRPKFRKGWWGLFGPQVDAINYYNEQLAVVDKEIARNRQRDFPPSSTAFITMTLVAQAQMLAQAVLDPKVNHLITALAPAPHDIIWDNLCLMSSERSFRIFMVMLMIGFISVLMVYPVRFLTNFLNVKSISHVSPQLGEFLRDHRWAYYLITSILPPYVFTILNVIMPYVYIWITRRQGYTLHGDEELSAVSKNFFYMFVNMFLVFTLFGTVTLSDTSQIANQLAKSLRRLSLFYVDLIILQGIGIFPYKLLLLGNLLLFPLGSLWCKTPRDYLELCKPPVFNFGLQLPQPMLVFIVTITYSVLSTKILTAGVVYFMVGFFVFKYQLLYACVHPPHNTGKVWPLVVRRVFLGLLIFQVTMFGTLASDQAYTCALMLLPLPLFVLAASYRFEKFYLPLSHFIALRSIYTLLPEEEFMDREQTLDERRENHETYVYPDLISELEGPVVAVEGGEVLSIAPDGNTVRRPL